MTKCIALLSLFSVLSLTTACVDFAPVDSEDDPVADPMADLRINEIQVIGSHNSYKTQPSDLLQAAVELVYGYLPPDSGVESPNGLVYSHVPLTEQFADQGIRQIELDVWLDPFGSLFAIPFGPNAAQALTPLLPAGLTLGPDFDPNDVMLNPGPKVFHIQDIDFRSSCLGFGDCLKEIAAWSGADPTHLPVLILLELKDEAFDPNLLDPLNIALGQNYAFAIPYAWTLPDLLALENDIRAAFHDTRMIQPNDVRNGYPTPMEGIQAEGWPTVGDSRGKVFFALDNEGTIRNDYANHYPALDGALIFTSSPPGSPEAAFRKVNDPSASNPSIAELVADGYLVRTRADADTVESRTNDTTRRDAALASGAQFISTDYRLPNLDFSDYQVLLPGLPTDAVARCSPIIAPPDCDSSEIAP